MGERDTGVGGKCWECPGAGGRAWDLGMRLVWQKIQNQRWKEGSGSGGGTRRTPASPSSPLQEEVRERATPP